MLRLWKSPYRDTFFCTELELEIPDKALCFNVSRHEFKRFNAETDYYDSLLEVVKIRYKQLCPSTRELLASPKFFNGCYVKATKKRTKYTLEFTEPEYTDAQKEAIRRFQHGVPTRMYMSRTDDLLVMGYGLPQKITSDTSVNDEYFEFPLPNEYVINIKGAIRVSEYDRNLRRSAYSGIKLYTKGATISEELSDVM